MLIGDKTDLVKLSKALEKIIAAAPKEDPEVKHDDLFGQNPDDAFSWGQDQTYWDVAQEIREALNND